MSRLNRNSASLPKQRNNSYGALPQNRGKIRLRPNASFKSMIKLPDSKQIVNATFTYFNSEIVHTPKPIGNSKPKASAKDLNESSQQSRQYNKAARELEENLNISLKELSSKENEKEFEVYKSTFSALIKKNQYFGKLLGLIEKNYEFKIQNAEGLPEYSTYKELLDKVSQLEIEKAKYLTEKMQNLNEFSRVSEQSVVMSRKLRKIENDIEDLQNSFEEKTKKASESFPEDEEAWKYLILKNQNYSELENQLLSEHKKYKKNEARLSRLVTALKLRGYCKELDQDDEVDSTDQEALIDCPLEVVKKPDLIPVLPLEKVEVSSPSSSSSESPEDD